MTKMERISELADLCGRAAIEHRKLVFAKHEGKSIEEVRPIEENLRKLLTEVDKIVEEVNEEHPTKKGEQ